jgi:hypothetical protein
VLLVLEFARVEVAVLLNELAFSKYESSESSQIDGAISQKQRNLAILFSLIERIIKMISDASGGEGMYHFLDYFWFHALECFCRIFSFPFYFYFITFSVTFSIFDGS